MTKIKKTCLPFICEEDIEKLDDLSAKELDELCFFRSSYADYPLRKVVIQNQSLSDLYILHGHENQSLLSHLTCERSRLLQILRTILLRLAPNMEGEIRQFFRKVESSIEQ